MTESKGQPFQAQAGTGFIPTTTFQVQDLLMAQDNFDRADPHRNQTEFDDPHWQTGPIVDSKLYDTSTTTPINRNNTSLTDLPDISDEIFSDYKMALMLGKDIPPPQFVDLDTAPDYSNFIKNTIANVIASEGEYNIDKQEYQSNIKQPL